jgi:hypothetical protein
MRRYYPAIAIAFLAVALSAPPAAARGSLGPISETNLGFSSAVACTGSPESNAIPMDDSGGYYNRLSVLPTFVWGTTTKITLKVKYSFDGTNYFWVQRCTSAVEHDCADRQWAWETADGTTPGLDFETNYPYLKLVFSCASGNGTVKAGAIRGKN